MRIIKFRGINDDGTLVYPTKRLFGGLDSGDILQRFSNVEQFTGLQDKNGKDIYEGDIIKAKLQIEQEDYSFTGSIIFENCQFKSDNADFEIWIYDEIEVIGNIHENPELS